MLYVEIRSENGEYYKTTYLSRFVFAEAENVTFVSDGLNLIVE